MVDGKRIPDLPQRAARLPPPFDRLPRKAGPQQRHVEKGRAMTLSQPKTDRSFGRPPQSEMAVFFKQWLRAPLEMGMVVPASRALCRLIAAGVVREPGEYVVETGAGTGAVSRALLDAGVPPEKLILVEMAPDLAAHLRRTHPEVRVIEGDARDLPALLPDEVVGRAGTVISGIPMTMLPMEVMRPMVEAMFALMPPGRRFLHYSFCITSPLPWRKLGLTPERVGFTFGNLPPASVWGYAAARATEARAAE
jgi:phosphatidylethanolamine/phosphatidyl-N-methylethanolamine N-methyltransferase